MKEEVKHTPETHDSILGMKVGQIFYSVTKQGIFSYWFVGINPKSDRSFLGISSSSVGKCEVINFSNSLIYIDYGTAKLQYIEVLKDELSWWEEDSGIENETASKLEAANQEIERLKAGAEQWKNTAKWYEKDIDRLRNELEAKANIEKPPFLTIIKDLEWEKGLSGRMAGVAACEKIWNDYVLPTAAERDRLKEKLKKEARETYKGTEV